MQKHHPKNERIKRQYLAYLEEAKRLSSKSADLAAASIAQFEASTGYKDFAAFHIDQARRFKAKLTEYTNPETGRELAKATIHARLMAVKAFFIWLAGQPGYKSRINYSDAEYFNPSANDTRIATAKRERPTPSLEQIRHVIATMPTDTDVQKRDRALVAFVALSGARDDAIASLCLKHIDLAARTISQDARQVRTKNRKTFTTHFFPVGDDLEAIVIGWVTHLRTTLLFGPDDPLFPATLVQVGTSGHFEAVGLTRDGWRNADAIRRIFKATFEAANLPYSNPHSIRKTLALLGEQICKTPEDFKAWSQNLGHEQVLTTFTSYGAVSSHRQREIMAGLSDRREKVEAEVSRQEIARVLAYLSAK
jgi:integrase